VVNRVAAGVLTSGRCRLELRLCPERNTQGHLAPIFGHALTASAVLPARAGVRLTPNAGIVNRERGCDSLVHPIRARMAACGANGIERIQAKADDECWPNDSDLRKPKLASRTNQILHGYLAARTSGFHERKQICGKHLFELHVKMSLE
jgi:hypothetical protein